MEGIQFLVDNQGKKTAVVINLEKYGDVWEDFLDVLTARERTSEPDETLEAVEERLRRQGKLDNA